MANAYMHAAKLSSDEFLKILHCYCNLDGPKTAISASGISKQSITEIYLKLSNRLRSIIPIPAWTLFYEDVREIGLGEINEDGSLTLINYGQFFHHFDNLADKYIKNRKQGTSIRKVEGTDLWKEINTMNERWNPVPEKHFDKHVSIALWRGMISVQAKELYDSAKAENREEGFWTQQEKDWPDIEHNNDIKTFFKHENITLFVEEDLKKFLLDRPLNKEDTQPKEIRTRVIDNSENIKYFFTNKLDKYDLVSLPVIVKPKDRKA